jgi:hypothetical protein
MLLTEAAEVAPPLSPLYESCSEGDWTVIWPAEACAMGWCPLCPACRFRQVAMDEY